MATTTTPATASGFQKYILITLQLALVADQEYAVAKAGGTNTLLEPNNFDNALGELAQIFAPAPPSA